MIYVILGFLMLKSMTKYDIKCNLEKEVSPFYAPSYGSINHSITKLLKDGLITFVQVVENGRQKKIYSLTDAGRSAFLSWLREPVTKVAEGQLLIGKIYFFGFLDREEQVASLKAYKAGLDEALGQYRAFEKGFPMDEIEEKYKKIVTWQMHTLSYGIMELETEQRFVDGLLEECVQSVNNMI